MRRYYEVLGLSEDANQDEIKKAYRRLASRLHPDKISPHRPVTEADQTAFLEIQEAYECLGDEGKRATYDETGATGKEEDPVDGMLAHVFKTLLEEGAPTVFDLLGTTKTVLDGLIQEAQEKLDNFREGLVRVQKMKEKVKYLGKEENPILLRTIDHMVLQLTSDIEDHEKAVTGGKLAYQKLKDYKALDKSAKKPNNRSPQDMREEEMPESLRIIDAMLRGKRY